MRSRHIMGSRVDGSDLLLFICTAYPGLDYTAVLILDNVWRVPNFTYQPETGARIDVGTYGITVQERFYRWIGDALLEERFEDDE